MKHLLKINFEIGICALSLVFVCSIKAQDPKVKFENVPEWQKPIIEKIKIDAQVKDVGSLLEKSKAINGLDKFVIFSCESKENIGKRILWADVELVLSNGSVFIFKHVEFNLLDEGVRYDIKKLPLETKDAVRVISLKIKSLLIK